MSNLVRRHGVWHCDFVDFHTGRRIRRSFGTDNHAIAERRLRTLIKEVENGEYWKKVKDKKQPLLTLSSYASEFISTDLQFWVNDANKRFFVNHLQKWIVPFLGANTLLVNITKSNLLDLRAKVFLFNKENPNLRNKNSSVNRCFTSLRTFLEKAVEKGYISVNPAVGIKPLKNDSRPSRVLREGEFKELVLACNQPLRDMVIVAAMTGLRAGEIVQLTDKCVLKGESCFWFSLDTVKTKTNRTRRVPLHPDLVPIILKRTRQKGLLFKSLRTGERYHYKKTWSRVLQKLGYQGLTFHGLRRSYLTELRRQGIDLLTLQSLAGHAKVTQTQHYIDSQVAEEAHAINAVGALNNWANEAGLTKENLIPVTFKSREPILEISANQTN